MGFGYYIRVLGWVLDLWLRDSGLGFVVTCAVRFWFGVLGCCAVVAFDGGLVLCNF